MPQKATTFDERPTKSVRLTAEDGRCEPFTVSTVTFFRSSSSSSPGDDLVEKVASHLRERLRLVLLNNPWLAGRSRKKNILTFPEHFYQLGKDVVEKVDEAALNAAIKKILQVKDMDPLPFRVPKEAFGSSGRETDHESSNTYTRLVEACNARCFCDNRQGVFKVSVCRTEDSTVVAVMVALAHVAGDGNTYYKILGMLSGAKNPSALVPERPNPVRKADHGLDRIMGREQRHYRRSLKMVKHGVWGNLNLPGVCGGRKESMNAFRINREEILRIKQGTDSKFVGSNDIIVSQFAKVTDPRLLCMIVDCRKYLAKDVSVPIPGGRALDLAGNYVTHWHWGPRNYETPEAVRTVKTAFRKALLDQDAVLAPRRKSLGKVLSSRLSRVFASSKVEEDVKKEKYSNAKPTKSLDVDIGYDFVVPKLGETVRFALISSWIFDDSSFEIPGMEHVLHLPTFPNPASFVSWEFAIVFQATPQGDLGMVVSSSRFPVSAYDEKMSVLDGPFLR